MIEKWNSNCFCVRLDSARVACGAQRAIEGAGTSEKTTQLADDDVQSGVGTVATRQDHFAAEMKLS
jgi:hypothetical protein